MPGRGTSQWTRRPYPAPECQEAQGGGLARICFRERRFTGVIPQWTAGGSSFPDPGLGFP